MKHFPYFNFLRVVLELAGVGTEWQRTPLQLASIEHAIRLSCSILDGALHLLSWMGLYGHSNPKPSFVMGILRHSCKECFFIYIYILYRSCLKLVQVSQVFRYMQAIDPKVHLPRRWQPKLRNRMTKVEREKFKASAKAIVKKGKKNDGSTSVSDSQYPYADIECCPCIRHTLKITLLWGSLPRTGVKGALRATQEYPVGFAAAVADLHLQDLHKKEATTCARD